MMKQECVIKSIKTDLKGCCIALGLIIVAWVGLINFNTIIAMTANINRLMVALALYVAFIVIVDISLVYASTAKKSDTNTLEPIYMVLLAYTILYWFTAMFMMCAVILLGEQTPLFAFLLWFATANTIIVFVGAITVRVYEQCGVVDYKTDIDRERAIKSI